MKLRGEILIIFIVTILLSMGCVGIVSITFSTKALNEQASDNISTATELAAQNISAQLKGFVTGVATSTANPVISDPTMPAAYKQAIIEGYCSAYGFTSGIITDANGMDIFTQEDLSGKSYVAKALAGEINVTSDIYSDLNDTSDYGVNLTAPITTSDGSLAGVISFKMDMTFVNDIISSIQVSDHSKAYIIDDDGNVAVFTDESAYGKPVSVKDGYFSDSAQIDGANGWEVLMTAPKTDFQSGVNRITIDLVICDVLAIILCIVVAFLLSGYITRATKRVMNALISVTQGDLSHTLPRTKRKDELSVLQNTTAELTDTLNQILGQANNILNAMSHYNLTESDMKEYPGEFNTLAVSINHIKSSFKPYLERADFLCQCKNRFRATGKCHPASVYRSCCPVFFH